MEPDTIVNALLGGLTMAVSALCGLIFNLAKQQAVTHYAVTRIEQDLTDSSEQLTALERRILDLERKH